MEADYYFMTIFTITPFCDGFIMRHFHFPTPKVPPCMTPTKTGCENPLINFNQIHPLLDALVVQVPPEPVI